MIRIENKKVVAFFQPTKWNIEVLAVYERKQPPLLQGDYDQLLIPITFEKAFLVNKAYVHYLASPEITTDHDDPGALTTQLIAIIARDIEIIPLPPRNATTI